MSVLVMNTQTNTMDVVEYRGHAIYRNFTSINGTGRPLSTQRGWTYRVTGKSGNRHESWSPNIAEAKGRIDRAIENWSA